jgi:hypothetical protein
VTTLADQAQIAEWLGVDPSYVASWIDRGLGFPEPDADGRRDFAEVQTWYQFRYCGMP